MRPSMNNMWREAPRLMSRIGVSRVHHWAPRPTLSRMAICWPPVARVLDANRHCVAREEAVRGHWDWVCGRGGGNLIFSPMETWHDVSLLAMEFSIQPKAHLLPLFKRLERVSEILGHGIRKVQICILAKIAMMLCCQCM